jgi:hypothetical protein
LAGEPGDRWLGHRKMAGREESPDTVVVGSQEPVTKWGNAPGNARGAVVQTSVCATVHGKCHREYTAGREKHGGIAQENLRDVFETLAQFGKGEKVG